MTDRIEIIQGDITRQEVDAIVNAANTSLLGGGGVDGAIHRGAGPGLLEECRALTGCATGSSKITGGYNLAATFVIHTVGPVWRGGHAGEAELLASCYCSSLKLALDNKAKTIAFPAISTGVYRFPLEHATRIAIREVKTFIKDNHGLEKVVFVCFDDKTYHCYQKLIPEVQPD
ncbi:O-acetyl-ADP-ribose deacetylase [Planctomycetota bacterium]